MNNLPKQIIFLPVIAIVTFFFVLFLYTKFVGSIPFSVNSITTTKTDLFQVTGEGKVAAIPDIAKINLGISVQRQTVKEAQNEANRVINSLSAGLKKLGIEEKDIKTQNYNLTPSYDFSSGRQKITGYDVNINLQVKVREFEKINEVIDLAAKDGANLIGGLQFTLDDKKLKDLKSQAREEAVREAKEKAEDLAKASGIKLGRIINVQETFIGDPNPQPFIGTLERQAKVDENTQIQPGESEITTTITLSYEIR